MVFFFTFKKRTFRRQLQCANIITSSLALIHRPVGNETINTSKWTLDKGHWQKQSTLMGWASGSCQRIKGLTYQKQVQIYSNWENEIMPEKTIKRAKKTLQKKHRAFNNPTGKIFLKFTQEFHLFVMLTSKRQYVNVILYLFLCSFSPLIFICTCTYYLHVYIFK